MSQSSFQSANEPQYREAYGRTVLTNQVYSLPKDQEELNRLDIQNEALKRLIGGLYVVPELVGAALDTKDGTVARVLDAGTGSGAWAIDMAKEHPECEVVGIDLTPPVLQADQPQNFCFQVADINKPLDLETASVNLVHARAIDGGIRHYPSWLSEVARVLRVKGAYLVSKGGMTLFRENGEEFPTVPIGGEGYSGLQNLLSAMEKAIRARWSGVELYESWVPWMEENGNFENIGRTDVLLPVGAWQSGLDEKSRVGAELMGQNTLKLINAIKPALMARGHEEVVVDKWIADATLEISELRVKGFIRWYSAWAIRSNNEWRPHESSTM